MDRSNRLRAGRGRGGTHRVNIRLVVGGLSSTQISNMEEKNNDQWLKTIKPLTSHGSSLFVESASKLLWRSGDKFSLKVSAAIDYALEIMRPH